MCCSETVILLLSNRINNKMKCLLLLLLVHLVRCDRTVTTTNGPVRGISLAPVKVEAFLGIPYAEPPVGQLRFSKPVLKSAWDEIYNADELPPSCVQEVHSFAEFNFSLSSKMSEDCLYLNFWVPEGGGDLKPVMLFIHGGGFMSGSTNIKLYIGANLAEHGDVIVATINYRVGTLGFFSGFIEEAAGSMGMYDQVMAMRWIKDNAKYFGGDPENIVLFGESAGAFSASMHQISPLSKGLFKRAILQSGSAINPMYRNDNELLEKMSGEIANLLGCADDEESLKRNPHSVVKCMKALPAEKFSDIEAIFRKSYNEYFWRMLLPRVGDAFLPENPVDSFRKGKFDDMEVLLGVNRDEGTSLLVYTNPHLFGTFGEKGENLEFNETSAKSFIKSMENIGDRKEYNKIFHRYFDRVKDDTGYTYLKAISDISGDFLINCGAVFQADFESFNDKKVYFYLFDYRPDSTFFAEWVGASHGEELQYVFGNPMYKEFTEFEKEFSRDIMDMWVAFAKSGNPSIPGGTQWPKYSQKDPKYVVLGKTDSIRVTPDKGRCELWRKQFRAMIDED